MSTSKGTFIDPFSGNIGIGTQTPSYILDVPNTVYNNNLIYVSGNIGIGTTLPTQQLHVVGNIQASNYDGIFTTQITRAACNAQRFAYGCNIAGFVFDGTQNITFNSITTGPYITGTSYNGSANQTWTLNASSTNTANYIVGRDANAAFSVRNIFSLSNVGIGTTIINKSLDIYGNLNFDTNSTIYINNVAGASNQLIAANADGTIGWAYQPGKQHYVLTVGSGTFIIPKGVANMYIQMWGAGGGGGAGVASTSACSGGGSGASGNFVSFMLSDIIINNITSFSYTVGTGGTTGVSGGSSSITINGLTITVAGGGTGGAGAVGGNSTGGSAPTVLTNTFTYLQFGNGLAGVTGTSGTAGTNGNMASTSWAAGSGGSGAGISGTTARNGGTGGSSLQLGGGIISGGTVGIGTTGNTGGNGGAGNGYLSATITIPGAGGGGGGNATGVSGIGGTGGAGGTPGGGGGGGGCGSIGAGNGGQGGDGLILVTCF